MAVFDLGEEEAKDTDIYARTRDQISPINADAAYNAPIVSNAQGNWTQEAGGDRWAGNNIYSRGTGHDTYTQDLGTSWEKTSREDNPGENQRPGAYGMQGNDPRDYMYGRTGGGADEAVSRAWATGQEAGDVGATLLGANRNTAQQVQNRGAIGTNWGNQNAALGQSGAYGNNLAGLESREGLSAAQSQLQGGTNAALANQMSMARSGRGFGGGAASAGLAQAGAAQTLANQTNAAASLRAQEQANWRTRQAANLTGAAGIQRDIGSQYGDQAQFETEAGYKNRSINDAAAADWAGLGQDAYFKGAQTNLTGQDVGAGIRGKEMEGGLAFEDNQLRYWAAKNDLALGNQERKDKQMSGWLGAAAAGGSALIDAFGSDGDDQNSRTRSDVRSKTAIVPAPDAGAAFARDTFGRDLTFDGSLYRRNAPMTAEERGRVRQSLDGSSEARAAAPAGSSASEPARAGSSEPTAAPRTVTAGGQQIEIKQPDTAALDAAAQAPGSFYDYKDPSAPGADGQRHYGPMAQDLAKTPAGATTVSRMPDGKLGVDTGRLSLVNTAAVSAQQKQIDDMAAQLEALLSKQAGGSTELAEYGNRGAAGARGYRAAR